MTDPIRLACTDCDTEECDGITSIPKDWKYVGQVQSYEEATAEVSVDDNSRSVMAWWTHLSTCPDCLRIQGDTD